MDQYLENMFMGFPNIALLGVLAVGIVILAKGADLLVDGAVGLSERLGIPKVIIGATVVSMGTTAPEAIVSVMAAFKGMSGFALGNSVGSIICDTGLIFGISCLITRLPLDRFVLNRHGWIQVGSGFGLVAISFLHFNSQTWESEITRWMGFLFLALLVGYMLISVHWARQHSNVEMEAVEEVEETSFVPEAKTPLLHFIILVVGLTLVILSSKVLLVDVQILCDRWEVPEAIVSATLVAFGTSLPELVTALASIRRGHGDLVIGNVIGADVLNVLFVTGAAASATALTVEPFFFKLHFPVMLAVLVIFRIAVVTAKGRHFAKWPGFVLLALYVAYAVGNYLIAQPTAH